MGEIRVSFMFKIGYNRYLINLKICLYYYYHALANYQ